MEDYSEVLTVTPTMARRWLDQSPFTGQRSVSEDHVTFLANEITQNRFRIDQLVLCHVNGTAYLTNGQHRLRACLKTGRSIKANVLHLACESMDEVKEDYIIRDRNRGRTQRDCFAAVGMPDHLDLNSRQVETFAGCLRLLLDGFAPQKGGDYRLRSPAVKIAFMEDWAEEASAWKEIATTAEVPLKGTFWRSAVMAVGLATLRYQQERATDFWTACAANDGLVKGAPTRALVQFLLQTSAQGKILVHTYARYAAAAWNAQYDGRQLMFVKVVSEAAPILIKGTPYDGKKLVTLDYE